MSKFRNFGAAAVILGLTVAACAPIEGRETAGQYVDDATISNTIRANLLKDQQLKAFDIHVDTMQGVVQLSGFVDSPGQRLQAEALARNTNGVRDVHDSIIVRGG